MTTNLTQKNIYKYSLIALIIILGLILVKELKLYLSGFLGAITLYVLIRGQMVYLTKKKKWSRSLSATIITLEALLFFLLPLTGIALLVIDTLSGVTIDPEMIRAKIEDFVSLIEAKVNFEIFTPDNITFVSKFGTNLIQTLASSVYSFIINMIMVVFILFYMLYQNEYFENLVKDMLPFSSSNKKIFTQESKAIIQANAIGIPLLAIIQGVFAYIGYIIFGLDSVLIYAIMTAFSTIIPMIGTMIVWIPLSLMLILQGDYTNGIGLAVYGFVVIGGSDNVARFMLQKRLADIHPLITVFGVLVGLPIFGFWGIIFGPLILSLFMLFINMYRYEYIPGSIENPRITKTDPDKKMKLRFKRKRKKTQNVEDSSVSASEQE